VVSCIRKRCLLYKVVLTTITLSLIFTSISSSQEENQDELDRLNKEISNLRNQISTLETEQKSVIRTIEQYRITRKVHEREVEILQIKIQETDKNISALEIEIEENKAAIALKQEKIGFILRKLFINGRFDMLKALLSVKSTRDMSLAHTYLSYLAKKDIRLIDEFREELKKLDENIASLEKEKDRLGKMFTEEEEHVRQANIALRKQQDILQQIKSRKGIYKESLDQKIEARKKLTEMLAQMERERAEAEAEAKAKAEAEAETNNTETATELKTPPPAMTGLSGEKGKLPWPVRGQIIEYYGLIKDKIHDVQIENDGIDIKAKVGTSVKAIAVGKVRFCSWHDAAGNLVVIEHGKGYYSLYAHLSRFDVSLDDYVKAGEVIGAVGETGSLKGPMLHFEIRQIRDTGPKALNPINWLMKFK
jgi:septal ring factor EnvC (AmiA/AmiB activator)